MSGRRTNVSRETTQIRAGAPNRLLGHRMDIFIRFLNPVLMIALALWLGVFLTRKFRLDWRLYFIGVVTFIASQVLHIPFNIVAINPWVQNIGLQGSGLVLISIVVGLSAGVFEEVARYLVFRFWVTKERTWEQALLFGAGHGGIEAILLGVLTLITVIRLVSLEGVDLQTIVPTDQLALAEAQVAAFWSLPWYVVPLGAFERAVALTFHMSATLLVLQVFKRKKIAWLFAAIGLHALINASAVFASQTWGIYAAAWVLVAFGVACLWIIRALRPTAHAAAEEETAPPPMLQIEREQLSLKNIEESRYDE